MSRLYWKKMMGAVALLALGLAAGCGKEEGNTTAQKEYVYVPEYQSIDVPEGIEQATVVGDTLYFRTGAFDDTTGNYMQQLGILKIGETTPKFVTLELPDEAMISGMNINARGNMQAVVTTYVYDESDAVDDEAVGEDADDAVMNKDAEAVEEAIEAETMAEETAESEGAVGEDSENEAAEDAETAVGENAEVEDSESEATEDGTAVGEDAEGEDSETEAAEGTAEADSEPSTVIVSEGESSGTEGIIVTSASSYTEGYYEEGYYEEGLFEEYQEPTGSKMELCEFDMEGKVVSSVDLTESLGEADGIYIEYLETDAEGNLYVGSEQTVLVIDSAGKMLCELEVGSWINNMFSTKDGKVLVSYYGEEQIEVCPVDVQAKKLGDAIEPLVVVDYGNYTFVKGSDTDVLFCADNTLYTYNFADEAPVQVLSWIDCDIDTDQVRTFTALEDGRILVITSNWSENGTETELIYLTKKKGSEVPEKKILTLGTMSLDYNVRKQIIEFNKTNQEYRVEVREYLTDYSMEGYEDALNRMSAEIVGGNCPDIIDMSSGENMQRYAAKGVLEDLYPYIDEDAEMNREDFLENILQAYETDGKLYALAPSFFVNTIIGKQSDFGDRKSITLDEVMEIADGMPEGMELYEYATKDSTLIWNTMMNMDQYVDWKSGTCQFNSEEFIKVLEFANRFETEYTFEENELSTPTKIRTGKLLMMNTSVSSVQEYQMYSAMFGEPITFVGYPTNKDNGSFISSGGTLLAMSSKSPYKDGVWQFIRRELTREAQENMEDGGYGFPVMKSALEQQFAKDMEEEYYEDIDGSKKRQMKTSWGYDDFNVEIYAAKEEEVEVVRELIAGVDTLYQYDEQINEIITEEAKAFFEGQKTAKEVADIIQSRVQIYVNENR